MENFYTQNMFLYDQFMVLKSQSTNLYMPSNISIYKMYKETLSCRL